MELTKEDSRVLSLCKNDWFDPDCLFPAVKRSRYRCDRLETLGLLESKIEGPYNNFQVKFRRIAEQNKKVSGGAAPNT